MAGLGRCGDTGLAERFAAALADELTAVGVTLNFAPVLDVHHDAADPVDHVIGDRALSPDPAAVGRFGAGLSSTPSSATVSPPAPSTFPGHGDTRADSHHELPGRRAPARATARARDGAVSRRDRG